MSEETKFDHYLNDGGPAALVIREHLMPVEGSDGVLFPATFAAGEGFPGGYNINTFGDEKDGKNVCLIDSVGSQANRIEPLFMQAKYQHLVPQIVIKAGEHEVNLLEAGHRAGDALVRCSSLQDEIEAVFRASIKGDALPLAKVAPTSLVFGVWNSRGQKGNQDRRPRLIASAIRAFNVRKLSRSAVYLAPVDYALLDIFSEEDKEKAEGDPKNPLSKRGFVNALASNTHGGVIADGGIRRDATLGLAALRHLHAGHDAVKSLVLRRYILGLSLVAFTAPAESYLRQGCTLVLNPDQPREFVEVYSDGRRQPCDVDHDVALQFATEAAKAFGIGERRTVNFEKERAKRDVKAEPDKKGKSKQGKKSSDTSKEVTEGQ
jgi:CRISPR-associated protein Csb1